MGPDWRRPHYCLMCGALRYDGLNR
jgi:hypothetical protein